MFFYNSLLIIGGFRFSDQEHAHSSVKCNTVTNVGKKLHREFYSLVFCAVCCLVDSESLLSDKSQKGHTKGAQSLN